MPIEYKPYDIINYIFIIEEKQKEEYIKDVIDLILKSEKIIKNSL